VLGGVAPGATLKKGEGGGKRKKIACCNTHTLQQHTSAKKGSLKRGGNDNRRGGKRALGCFQVVILQGKWVGASGGRIGRAKGGGQPNRKRPRSSRLGKGGTRDIPLRVKKRHKRLRKAIQT